MRRDIISVPLLRLNNRRIWRGATRTTAHSTLRLRLRCIVCAPKFAGSCHIWRTEFGEMRSQRQARVLVGLGPFFMVSSLILLLTGSGLYAADGRAEAQAHADSGLQLARSGDLPSAEELRQAVKLEPHNPEFL